MIIRQLAKKHDLSEYARWFLIAGQLGLWFGILLSQLDRLVTALLSGILIGISLVANITYLQIRPHNESKGDPL